MTITYPLDFPFDEFRSADFELDMGTSQNVLANGQIQGREYTTPAWYGKFSTAVYMKAVAGHPQKIAAWRGWWAALRGYKPFLAYDPSGKYPALYPHGRGLDGWDGVGGVSDIGARFATLDGMQAQLSVGDYVGFEQSGKYSLHRVTEAGALIGDAIGIGFEPYINTTLFTSSAVSRVIRAACVMVPVPNSFSAPVGVEPASITFEGRQRVW